MVKARVARLEQTSQGALGVLLIEREIFCFTLEPDAADAVKSQAPEGLYQCRRFHGAKWKDTFEIIVPGHTAVLFHAGNTEADSQMCMLLGATTGKLKGNRAVLNSGATFQRFLERLAGEEEFNLVIEDRY